MKFTLKTKPISILQMYNESGMITPNGSRFVKDIAEEIGEPQVLLGPLELTIHFCFGSKASRRLVNFQEAIINALKRLLYCEENQIWIIHVAHDIDLNNPRIELEIKKILTHNTNE